MSTSKRNKKRLEELRESYEWSRNEEQRDDKLLSRYCRRIMGVKADFELTFEEYVKLQEARENAMRKGTDSLMDRLEREVSLRNSTYIPKGMTKTAWLKQKRRKIREMKEMDKQRRFDQEYKRKMVPYNVLVDELEDVFLYCECSAESIRQGKFCVICRLFVNVHKYMLALFSDAAEGRSKE